MTIELVSSQEPVLNCNSGQTMSFDEKTNKTVCLGCPANCQYCLVDLDGKTKCTTCNNGFYKAGDGNCQACASQCDTCYGSGVEKCMFLNQGYFYERETGTVKECPSGCVTCDNKNHCVRCKYGYRQVDVLDQDGKPLTIDGHATVNCMKCIDPLCQLCKPDNFELETCNHCEQRHGLNPNSKKCEPCPEGCLSCQSNSQICQYCMDGFQKDNSNGRCQKIEDPNCGSFDIDSKKCVWCNLGFVLDPTNNSTCTTCSAVTPFCTRCGVEEAGKVNPTPNPKNLRCQTCLRGFTLNADNGTCVKCPRDCSYCSVDGTCYSCEGGYYLDGKVCKRNDMPLCDYMSGPGECISCSVGSYSSLIGGKTICNKCDSSCLGCSDPSKQSCVSCAVNQVTLKSVNPNSNAYLYQSTMSCLDRCPEVDPASKSPLGVDEFNHECLPSAKPAAPPKPKAKYAFERRSAQSLNPNDLILDSVDFVTHHMNYISQSITESFTWADKNPETSKLYSKQCSARGVLIEKINFDRETYFECMCNPGYHGTICSVDKELYDSEQTYLLRFFQDIRAVQGKLQDKDFYEIYRNLNTASMNSDALTDITNLMFEFHNATHLESKSPKEFLSAIDHLIKSHYRQHLEIERDLSNQKMDIDQRTVLQSMYDRLHYILTLATHTLLNSLKYTDNFNLSATNAFQVVYRTPIDQTFGLNTRHSLITVYPSDLLNLGNNRDSLTFRIYSQKYRTEFPRYEIFAWVYSSLLFSKTGYAGNFASYMFGLNLVDKRNSSLVEKTNSEDYLLINFPMRIVPAENEFSRLVRCIQIEYHDQRGEHIVKETEIASFAQNPDSQNFYVTCKFENPRLEDVYFTVGYNGEKNNTRTAHLARNAMDESDDFVLDKAALELPNLASLFRPVAAFLLLALSLAM